LIERSKRKLKTRKAIKCRALSKFGIEEMASDGTNAE
jgi:hypothetical protein